MQKSCFLAFGLFLGSLFPAFAEGYKSVVVKLTDGTTTTVNLSTELTTTFSDSEAIFSDATTRVAFQRSQLATFEFSKTSGIHALTVSEGAQPSVDVAPHCISIDGLAPDTPIRLHDAAGKCVSATHATDHFIFDTSALSTGTYILSVGTATYKIVKR